MVQGEGPPVTTIDQTDLYYDPYDVAINADPYPAFARLREDAPIYHNEKFDFWALSRHADVERAFADWRVFSNSRSDILDIIKSGVELPPGVVMFKDPPQHTLHRSLMSRLFTPRKVAELEPQIRDFCARYLDRLVGEPSFDIIAEFATFVPMRVIGMLLGIPEADQLAVRDRTDDMLRTRPGKPMNVTTARIGSPDLFADYIAWRAEHPSDDLMTVLLNAEFEDETGTTRTLTRDEVLMYTSVLAGAGNETTGRLIGWLAKVLADHPDQRRELVEDRSLVPNAIEELLRFEPPGPAVGRYVPEDVVLYDTTVPAGSAMLFLVAAANRDDRRFEQGERFDVHRNIGQHLTFGYGIHFCLGAALARLEGRVALDEVLSRFPEWEVDSEHAVLNQTSTVRGWGKLPVFVP
jgi:cytochrome P450